MKAAYKIDPDQYIAEVMARTLCTSMKCDWYPGDNPHEFQLVRDDQWKAMLVALPNTKETETWRSQFIELELANKLSTTLKAFGVKLVVARRAPQSVQFATLDGNSITHIHAVKMPYDETRQYGWIIEAVEFRRVAPLPDNKEWSHYTLQGIK